MFTDMAIFIVAVNIAISVNIGAETGDPTLGSPIDKPLDSPAAPGCARAASGCTSTGYR
jgi:hypothetical protein